jgi:hypothetical protein
MVLGLSRSKSYVVKKAAGVGISPLAMSLPLETTTALHEGMHYAAVAGLGASGYPITPVVADANWGDGPIVEFLESKGVLPNNDSTAPAIGSMSYKCTGSEQQCRQIYGSPEIRSVFDVPPILFEDALPFVFTSLANKRMESPLMRFMAIMYSGLDAKQSATGYHLEDLAAATGVPLPAFSIPLTATYSILAAYNLVKMFEMGRAISCTKTMLAIGDYREKHAVDGRRLWNQYVSSLPAKEKESLGKIAGMPFDKACAEFANVAAVWDSVRAEKPVFVRRLNPAYWVERRKTLDWARGNLRHWHNFWNHVVKESKTKPDGQHNTVSTA